MAIDPATLPLIDNLNRADGALGGGWSGNKVNTGDAAVPVISGNRMAWGGSSPSSSYLSATGSPPIGARTTIAVLPTDICYPCSLVKTGNSATPTLYRLRYNPTATGGGPDFQVSRVNAGTVSFLHGDDIANKPISAGDKLALTLDTDNTITAWIFHGGFWVVISSGVDGVPLTGPYSVGMMLGDATLRIDDVSGGAISTVTGIAGASEGTGTTAGDMDFGDLDMAADSFGLSELDGELLAAGLAVTITGAGSRGHLGIARPAP